MMNLLYGLLINITVLFLQIVAVFNKKIKRFFENRKNIFTKISNQINSKDQHIWIHAASLGEYELAVPLIINLKKKYDYKIILTFFSESGFKLKERINEVDYTFYLPIDTKSNSRNFIQLINPCFSIFIKSEIWPNYIAEIIRNRSKIYLVEGSFKKGDWYFSIFNDFIKNKLKKFDKIFVQDKNSLDVLEKNNIRNVEVSGSLKFDRVKYQLTLNNKVEKIDKLLKSKRVVVFGSTWQEDEKLIVKFIEENKFNNLLWIIAPHDISQTNINKVKNSFASPVSIYSKSNFNNNIIIINTIGDLKKLYSYAEIAYVGGGMGNTGLHNILEACVFEIPVLIGKNYTKFKESIDLVNLGGVISVKNQNEFNNQFKKLIDDKNYRTQISNKTINYFKGKTGATKKILKKITL